MHIPAHQRTIEEFAEHDGFIRAAVGLVSLSGEFDRILDRYAPMQGSDDDAREDARTAAVRYAVLGAIALRRLLGAHFEAMATEGLDSPSTGATADATKHPHTGGLLR